MSFPRFFAANGRAVTPFMRFLQWGSATNFISSARKLEIYPPFFLMGIKGKFWVADMARLTRGADLTLPRPKKVVFLKSNQFYYNPMIPKCPSSYCGVSTLSILTQKFCVYVCMCLSVLCLSVPSFLLQKLSTGD